METNKRDDSLMALLGGLLVDAGIRVSRANLENVGNLGNPLLREEDGAQGKKTPATSVTAKEVPEVHSIEVTYFPCGDDGYDEESFPEDEDIFDEEESVEESEDTGVNRLRYGLDLCLMGDEGVKGPVEPQDLPDPAWHGECLPKDFESIARRQIEVYKKKNSDYGGATHTLYCEYGLVYYLIMLEQKMLRLKSLVGKKNLKGLEPNYESLEESLLDMSNYALLAVESLRKGKDEK